MLFFLPAPACRTPRPASFGANTLCCLGCSLRGGGFAGALLALGGDALQQFRGRFVVRVLRHELAGEGVAQDRLAERLGALQLGVEFGFEVVDDGELVFDGFDDGFLFD